MKLTVVLISKKPPIRAVTFFLEDRREIVLFARRFLTKEPAMLEFLYSVIPEDAINDIVERERKRQEEREKCPSIATPSQ